MKFNRSMIVGGITLSCFCVSIAGCKSQAAEERNANNVSTPLQGSQPSTADQLNSPDEITDSFLTEFSTRPAFFQTEHLSLRNSKVTGPGLVNLVNLPLRSLDLSGSLVTDPFMVDISQMSNLETLDLSRTKITDQSLVALAKLKKLSTLKLNGIAISDKGCEDLTKVNNLRTLSLNNTKITDSGLKSLLQLKYLKTLDLADDQITESGIVSSLPKFPNLQNVNLHGCVITPQAIESLKNSSPNLRIRT